MKKPLTLKCMFFTLLIFSGYIGYAQKGKDGAKTITTLNAVVNEYASLITDADSGANFIKVSSSALNDNNRFSGPLSSGDLIMIIQMQGATINGTSNDSTWGAITNYNNCGLYEFSEVDNVPDASTISLTCPLKHNYTTSGRVQVVRVPRYASLTVNSPDTLTCTAWNGTIGGVVAVEVLNDMLLNQGSVINASGKGFRGGVLSNLSGSDNIVVFSAPSGTSGGQKGEGIVGYQNDYNIYGGGYCRGAAGNAGGGGNGNAAGGGGANAGDVNSWTGNGNPDTTTSSSWIAAWNLEYAGFAKATSSGGGKGGRTASFGNQNALITPPGDPSWGFDNSRSIGGKGGRPLDYSTGRIFMGGGGGAGGENNSVGGPGGVGGGIIYILSLGTLSGTGVILSNGGAGGNALSGSYQDAPGGAGGGGTVLINASGTVSNIQISANGGKGGDQVAAANEAEGGGGGGGGGYIALSAGTVTQQVSGGVNGVTHSPSFTEFIPDGATKGGDGLSNQPIINSNISFPVSAGPDVTICNGQGVLLNGSGGNAASYSWSPSAGLSSTNSASPLANPTITTQYILTSAGGACTAGPSADTVLVVVVPAFTLKPVSDTMICMGQSLMLNPSGLSSVSYVWSPAAGLSCTICPNPVATPSAGITYTVIAGSGTCTDTAQVKISLGGIAHAGTATPVRDTLCAGTPGTLILSGNSSNNIQWQSSPNQGNFGNTGPLDTTRYKTLPLLQTTYYRAVVGSGNCIDTSNTVRIFIPPQLTAFFSYSYSGHTVTFSDSSFGDIVSYNWAFGDGGTSNDKNPTHTYAKIDTTYYVCLTLYDGSNCSYTFCRYVTNTTGIGEIVNQNKWTVYPVPFNNELIISSKEKNQPVKNIELYDVLGRTVLNKVISGALLSPIKLDVSGLAKGMYFLQIKTTEMNYEQKIIKL